MFLSRCISRERSEDTLQRLLEKVNRVPLHEDFHFRVTNGQRAEVKRACTAKEYPDFRVRFVTKKSFSLQAYHSNKYKFNSIYLTFFVAAYSFGPTITAIMILTASPGRYGITPMKRPSLKERLISFASQTVPKI